MTRPAEPLAPGRLLAAELWGAFHHVPRADRLTLFMREPADKRSEWHALYEVGLPLMRLEDILALAPAEGADAATITAAISAAEAKRKELLVQAEAADRTRAGALLTMDDRALAKLEQDAAQARRAAERIALLLPTIRATLPVAQAREAMAELRTVAEAVADANAELATWQAENLSSLVAAIRAGGAIQDRLMAAWKRFTMLADCAYRYPENRDAGPVAEIVGSKGVPDLKRLPRNLFPFI